MYAKLNNGVINYAPKNYVTENGQYIANFNKNVGLMIKYGFKEVKDIRPVYNEETQYLHIKGYNVYGDYIFISYEVLELQEPEPALEDRVTNLENEVGNLSAMLIQTLELNDDSL